MNIETLIETVAYNYNLTPTQKQELLSKYKNATNNPVSLEVELNSIADYYSWQNKVDQAIKNAPPLQANQNYYIRTYDEKSNIVLQGVNIEKISDTNSGINQIEKVLIDNKYKAYKKVNRVDVADNDLEIAICQIGNLLNVSGAEEYTVYNSHLEKDSIISRSVAETDYEEYYDFTSLNARVEKYIKEGKIKNSKITNYQDFQFQNKKEDYIKIIDRSIQILKSLPMISQKDIKEIEKSYFNMIIFGYITNQVDRNLNNYGIICNKKTKEYRFAPLFDNSIITLPNLEENQCSFNGYICDRNKLIDCLFDNYYEDIKEKITYIIDNKTRLIKIIDIISKQNLDLTNYNKLMEKIIKNISYLEQKYQEKNNIVPNANAGYVNALNMVIILTIITVVSISLAILLLRT